MSIADNALQWTYQDYRKTNSALWLFVIVVRPISTLTYVLT